MVVADPSFNVSTKPVLKDTPCLANISFGLSVSENGLMNFCVCCFALGAISPAAVIKELCQCCRPGLYAEENRHVQNGQRTILFQF